MSGDDGLGLLALFNGVRQRLLAENVLAGVHGNLDHLNMRCSIGDDGNRLDVRVGAQCLRVVVHCGNAQFLSDLLCAVEVCVCDSYQLRTRNAVCNVAGMLVTQTTYTDDTNLQLFHRNTLLCDLFY